MEYEFSIHFVFLWVVKNIIYWPTESQLGGTSGEQTKKHYVNMSVIL